MAAERSDTLAALFPTGVAVFTLGENDPAPEPLPAEVGAVQRAVPKRRAEFARGRACARAALASLGVPAQAIPVGPDRAPLWPGDAIGSITHCRGLVAAAVGRGGGRFRSLGLDAEPRESLEVDLAKRIATMDELEDADGRSGLPPDVLPRLIFSAKEVVHKCVHPLARQTLDFLDVAIVFDHDARAFSVEARTARAEALPEIAAIRGRYRVDDRHIVTGGATLGPS